MTPAITERDMYALYDETQGVRAPVVMHDAARPFVVIHRYHTGYKHGMRTEVVGRYETRAQGMAAMRRRRGA